MLEDKQENSNLNSNPAPGYDARIYNTEAPKKKKKNGFLKVLLVVAVVALALFGAYIGGKELYVKYFDKAVPAREETAPVQTEKNGNVFSELFEKQADSENINSESKKTTEGTVGLSIGNREKTVVDVKVNTGELLTAAQVYASNVNATVGITVGVTTNYWGYKTTAAASGSGFIITDDGYILTNYHVIENASSITVKTYSGESYDAAVVGTDESNDIAVLKIDANNLQTVVVGDSDNMNVGDTVLAIGNPLGELTFSLTQGIVSALGREITLSGGVTMDLIQTDCAINSGNSGGALFNLYGEVIGITNAKYSGSGYASSASIDNIGFAIPINSVVETVKGIIEKGYKTKPYIGVSVYSVDEASQSYGVPSGAAVASVVAGSPAEEGGLKANDIITAVNGTEISTSDELVEYVSQCSTGDKLVFSVYRQGKTGELTVVVGETISYETDEKETTAENDDPFGGGFIIGQDEFDFNNNENQNAWPGQQWGGFSN